MHDETSRKKMSAKAAARWQDDPEVMRQRMNQPSRVKAISAAMSRRNADPAFKARMRDPEMIARRNASIRAAWAKRKAAKAQSEAA